VLEVFASIQGEGRYVGEPQVLVRLRGCPLRCRWCDTPGSWTLGADASAERPARWEGADEIARRVADAERGVPRTVSVTGGEPLMWPELLLELRPALAPRRLHLETGGGHPRSLARVAGAFDHVSLDLKLPADLDAPVPLAGDDFEPSPATENEWSAARRACLALVRGRDACAKLVVAGGRDPRDYEPLLADLARIAPAVPLYLQPVTPMRGVAAPSRALVERLVERALALGLAVRVVGQVHRALGLR
jgi:organic radical activating enzyme